MLWSLMKWYALFTSFSLLGVAAVLAWDWLNWRRLPWLRRKAERERSPSGAADGSATVAVLASPDSPAETSITSSVAIPDWDNASPPTLSIATSSVN